jgi:D-mannonate dehydratase
MYNVQQMAKAMTLVPSERNGVCFCQGTFASGGETDMPSAIESVGKHIKYVHFRDVIGQVPHFVEVGLLIATIIGQVPHFVEVGLLIAATITGQVPHFVEAGLFIVEASGVCE